MNTKILAEPRPCEYERVDDNHHSYMCCKDAKIEWIAREDAQIAVCPACLNWLRTLESLDKLK